MKKIMLIVLVVLGAVIPLIFWARMLSLGASIEIWLYDVGKACGLSGFVLLVFQFILGSKIRFIERGVGLDNLIRLHRRMGIVGLILISIHPVSLILSDILMGIYELPLQPMKLIGVVSLILMIAIAVISLRRYQSRFAHETWRRIHRIMYLIFPVVFVHSMSLGSDLRDGFLRYYWFGLAGLFIWALGYRLWRRRSIRKNPYEVSSVSQETHDTWTIRFRGRRVDYQPGQFMIVQLARNRKVSEPHPFTISSSPTDDDISITVKSVGDFTSTIGETNPGDIAYIDAPYGVFSYLRRSDDDPVFIAGGIGITPFISMLRHIKATDPSREVLLIWGNKTERDVAFRSELADMMNEMPNLRIVNVMSAQPDWDGERGYIDRELLSRYLDTFDGKRFYVCGPPAMMATVIKALRNLGVDKKHIHYERFAL